MEGVGTTPAVTKSGKLLSDHDLRVPKWVPPRVHSAREQVGLLMLSVEGLRSGQDQRPNNFDSSA